MPAQAKVTILGDAKHAVGEANRFGESLKNAAGHTGAIEKGMERANHHILGSLGKAASLAIAIEAVATALEKVNERAKKTAEGNRTLGEQALARSRAMAKAGISDIAGVEEFVRQSDNGATMGEQTAAIEAFATASTNVHQVTLPNGERSQVGGFGKRKFQQYMMLVNTGVYESGELIDKLKRGEPLPSFGEAKERLDSMSPRAVDELRERGIEHGLKVREMEALDDAGRVRRLGEAKRGTREAENPLSSGFQETIKDTAGKVPVVGGVVSGGIESAQRNADENAQSQWDKKDSFWTPVWQRQGTPWAIAHGGKTLEQINENTRKSAQPTLAIPVRPDESR